MPHLRLCQITLTTHFDCQNPVPDDFPMDICEMHALMTVAVMKERGGEVMRRLDSMYEPGDVPRVSHKDSIARPPMFVNNRPSVVYYMRFGERVKIGTSRSLIKRLQGVPHDDLLAIEPGTFADERLRHLQFSETRIHGEWFHLTTEIQDHTTHLVRLYGEPFTTYSKWESVNAA